MASNYPADPKNAASLSATPQSSPGGTAPEYPLPANTPQLGGAQAGQIGVPPDSGGHSGGNNRRLAPGTELQGGKYRIERPVASGGMGAVYLAMDRRFDDDEPCAVKEMLDDFHDEAERAQAVEWFKREAKFLLKLNHPSIPRVRDFFAEGGRRYLVMDFIEGRTLAEVFAKEANVTGVNGARGVSEERARSWARQICSVLTYLHSQEPPVIFRDLKPANIMVTNRDEIKLIDFGIARTVQTQRQATIIMTVGYAPPEQMQGNPEPRSDLFALGSTIHRVLTQHDAANNKPTIFNFPTIRSLRPDVTVAFDMIIMKALAVSVEQRWSSAAEMERAIINLPPLSASPVQPLASAGPASVLSGERLTPAHANVVNTSRASQATGLIRAAQEHLTAGRIEQAFTAVNQAFQLDPNNALIHKIYGQVFARRQPPNTDLAIQAYNRSLQANPNDAETHKLVGDVFLFLRKQPTQAIQPYTQSLRLNSSDFETHQRLAKCYEETNQLEAALREYQEAVRLLPPSLKRPELHYALGQLAYRMRQFPLAERSFVQVLTINPADHATRFLLSQVYEMEGKLADAQRECGYVVQAAPNNQAAQVMLQRLRGSVR
ncbi:MAG TPA: serine/threonine-protein kinase [Ktedonobacteraceae bacterium]|nr:serine/threonine-protein kinase [Ktedonobacteraceae bacterium]